MRIAIIGCGWVAGTQVEEGFARLPDLFQLEAACEIDGARLAAFSDRHGIRRRVTRFEDVLAMPDIEAVSICTPPDQHHRMVRAALAAGKHVLCEKPFTSSLALMDDVIEAQKTSQARVMPIFQYRFGPGFQKAMHLVRSGLPGRLFVSSVETSWKRGADYYKVPWRGKFATELGGVLVTQSIHIHDLFLSLAGPVSRVAGFKATRVNPIEVEDCAVACLEMADGSLATLTATLGSAQPLTRLRLCFENLTIERESRDLEAPKPALDPWRVIPTRPGLEVEIDRILSAAPTTDLFFAGQFRAFHEAIATGREFPVTLADARRALELITALYEAGETHTVEQLPLDASHPRYAGWSQQP